MQYRFILQNSLTAVSKI